MENKSQHVIFNIDRSGSMTDKILDTIGGINNMLEELKKNKDKNIAIYVSIKLFDHEEIMLIRKKLIELVTPLTPNDFVPRGQTALYDSMGRSLNYLKKEKQNKKNLNLNEECLLVTATDGLENCSKQYNSYILKNLIQECKSYYNIKCLYLGANQDAILEAQKIGIDFGSAINYDETNENINAVYRSAAAVVKRSRTEENPSFSNVERQASSNREPRLSRQNASQIPPTISRHQTFS